ncbi:MAG: MarR family winged helix-turn-helix transcriptional regulator [Flavobacteriales bacterium]
MKPEQTIDFHIRWAWSKISRMYNIEAAKYGGSMSIGYVLLNIEKEGTPSTKLGPKMGMESRSLTRTLKTLEEEGLIVRKSDKEDKRMVRVFLTPEGKREREHAREVVIQFNSFMQNNIEKDKLNLFFEVMSEINHLIENKNIFKD